MTTPVPAPSRLAGDADRHRDPDPADCPVWTGPRAVLAVRAAGLAAQADRGRGHRGDRGRICALYRAGPALPPDQCTDGVADRPGLRAALGAADQVPAPGLAAGLGGPAAHP